MLYWEGYGCGRLFCETYYHCVDYERLLDNRYDHHARHDPHNRERQWRRGFLEGARTREIEYDTEAQLHSRWEVDTTGEDTPQTGSSETSDNSESSSSAPLRGGPTNPGSIPTDDGKD